MSTVQTIVERRDGQRRIGIPRRIVADRRVGGSPAKESERRVLMNRRVARSRRRILERRIGLSPYLHLYLLGI
jgi:hypothetical protein